MEAALSTGADAALPRCSLSDVDPPGVGTILTDAGVANFMSYIEAGGNFVGIHS
jgi:hypothetical protein